MTDPASFLMNMLRSSRKPDTPAHEASTTTATSGAAGATAAPSAAAAAAPTPAAPAASEISSATSTHVPSAAGLYTSTASSAVAAAAAAGLPASTHRGPQPQGRALPLSPQLVYNVDERLPGEAQPQLEVTPITLLKGELARHQWRQVAVNASYISYGLKAGHLRLLDRGDASRGLLKKHGGAITDLQFYGPLTDLLASAGADGSVLVHGVTNQGGEVVGNALLHVALQGAEAGSARLGWHPGCDDLLFIGSGSALVLASVSAASAAAGGGSSPVSLPVPLGSPPPAGMAALAWGGEAPGQLSSNLAVSPDGRALAVGLADGRVAVFDVPAVPTGAGGPEYLLTALERGPGARVAAVFMPFGGGRVAAVRWVQPSGDSSRQVLLVADDLCVRLALYEPCDGGSSSASDGSAALARSYARLQELRFDSGDAGAFYNHVALGPPGTGLIAVANTNRNALYALHLTAGASGGGGGGGAIPSNGGKDGGSIDDDSNAAAAAALAAGGPHLDYIAEFSVSHPVLNFTAMRGEDREHPGRELVRLYCVQTNGIQQYSLDPAACRRPDLQGAAANAAAGIGAAKSAGSEASAPAPSTLASLLLAQAPASAKRSAGQAANKDGPAASVATAGSSGSGTGLPPTPSPTPIPGGATPAPEPAASAAAPAAASEPSGTVKGAAEGPGGAEETPSAPPPTPAEQLPPAAKGKGGAKSGPPSVSDEEAAAATAGIMAKVKVLTVKRQAVPATAAAATANDTAAAAKKQPKKGEKAAAKKQAEPDVEQVEEEEGEEGEEGELEEGELPRSSTAPEVHVFPVAAAGVQVADAAGAVNADGEGASGEPALFTRSPAPGDLPLPPSATAGGAAAAPNGRGAKATAAATSKAKAAAAAPAAAAAAPAVLLHNLLPPEVPATTGGAAAAGGAGVDADTLAQLLQEQRRLLAADVVAAQAAHAKALAKEFKAQLQASEQRSAALLRQMAKQQAAAVQQERSAMLAAARQETDRLIASVSGAINRDLPLRLQEIVRGEVGTAVAAALPQALPQALAGGALQQGLERALTGQLQQGLQRPIQDSFRGTFQRSVIPALETAVQAMFGQVQNALTKGFAEHAAAAQAQIARGLKDLAAAQAAAAPSSSTTTTAAGGTASTARGGKGGASASSAATATPSQQAARDDPMVEMRLLRLVRDRDHNEAFTQALVLNDVDKVVWLCRQIPASVLEADPGALTQPVLLSLVQQLGVDLPKDTATKLPWIQAAAMALQPSDRVIAPHLRSVLTSVYSNLQLVAPSLRGEQATQARVAMHVVNSLLHQCPQ